MAVQQDVGGKGRYERAAGGVACRTGCGLHAVVLQDGHLGLGQSKSVEPGPAGVGKDAGGDGHAEPPAGLEPDVQIGQRQDGAQHGAHQHGPPGQLGHAVAPALVDLLEPLPLDLFGRPLKTRYGQFEVVFRCEGLVGHHFDSLVCHPSIQVGFPKTPGTMIIDGKPICQRGAPETVARLASLCGTRHNRMMYCSPHCVTGVSMNSLIAVFFVCAAPLATPQSPFALRDVTPTAVELTDNGKPVYVYNYGPVLAPGFPESMRRSGYLSPVYAPNGVVLTDDFNRDHPHHRGIAWMWPEVTVGDKKGDMWLLKGFQERFVRWKARETEGSVARLAVENGWFDGDREFVKEVVNILAPRFRQSTGFGVHAPLRGVGSAGPDRRHAGRQERLRRVLHAFRTA